MQGVIIGIDRLNNQRLYRVVAFNRKGSDWEFIGQKATEIQLVDLICKGKLQLLNAKVEVGKLKGSTGDLNRFENTVNHPLVILSEFVSDNNVVLGYKVASYDSSVKNVKVNDLIEHCKKVTSNGGIPIQNGQFVDATANQKAHIRCYPGGEYIKEIIVRKKSDTARPAQVNTEKNDKAISKIEELFNKEQIEQLRLGKQHGVNIRIYGNNRLSAEQMQIIREALEDGIDAKLFADPDYSVKAMRILRADMKYGADVSLYLNPKYSAEQLSELANGVISGVDITQYADPKIPHEEMIEIRVRLENNIWKEHKVEKDKSWK